MRDHRFVAQHRGGTPEKADHYLLAAWAATCAERVLPIFESHSGDDRPRLAIETAQAWSRGEIRVGVAQKAAVAAHAAAREADNSEATFAARAAGHAVATAHMADHYLGAVIYGTKATIAAGKSAAAERDWMVGQVPDHLRTLVVSFLDSERFSSWRSSFEQPDSKRNIGREYK